MQKNNTIKTIKEHLNSDFNFEYEDQNVEDMLRVVTVFVEVVRFLSLEGIIFILTNKEKTSNYLKNLSPI